MAEKIFIPTFMAKMTKAFQVREKEESAVLDDDTKIKVNQALSKVSLIYEKLRNVVDYNDEHLLRKNAIFRILKRLIVIERRDEDLGKLLLQELIRINYLPNNTVPESRAKEVDIIIRRYLFLDSIISQYYKTRVGFKLLFWFLQIASCEIEEILFDFNQRKALTLAMLRVLKRDVELPIDINERDQNILFNLTVLRSLLKSDEVILYYYLLTEFYPELFASEINKGKMVDLITNWVSTKAKMDYYLYHPLRYKLGRISKKYGIYFVILRDVLQNNQDQIDQIITHPRLLEEKISEVCEKRYKEIRIKVVRAVIRSIIYIFITKMTLALLIEVPIDYILEQGLNYYSLLINILFPPFLMFVISLFIRLPRKRNTEKIIKEVKEIVYQHEEIEKRFHIRSKTGRSSFTNFFFNLFYFITYGITFGVVVWFLIKLDFNILSGTIFIFFLCLVSFFAITIRLRARELIVLDSKEGIINFLFDLFTLPIVRMGQWLSIKLSKINIFVFFLDFVIEAPLKIILEVVERWFSFVREKKEEIY
jgi:hypothetical protein